jgi:hypothetical protein
MLRDYDFEFQFGVREVGSDFFMVEVVLRTLPAAIIFDRFYSIMAKDGFAEIQRQLEAAASELRTATNPQRRRVLLREMSRLLAEAQQISTQPIKMSS